jgi:lipoprotein-anchoring transpeptidase ErfK/SrfK
MGKRRLYEIAKDRGLTTAELMRRLEQAGVQGKKPLSTLEEEEVEAALSQASSDDGQSPDKPQEQRLPPVERLLLWRKLRHLRKLHEAQLKELAGLAVELRRLDSPRYQELAAERLSEAAKTDKELIELERQLSPDDLGGECPKCGLHSTRTRYCLRCGEKLTGRRADSLSVPGALVAIIAISAAWLLGGANLGGGGGNSPQQAAVRTPVGRTARAPALPKYESIVAIATGSKTPLYHAPTDPSPYTTLTSPNLDGAPQAFLVKRIIGKWAFVYLPVRPNGSTGWIRLKHVKLAKHSYRVVIKLDSHRIVVYRGTKVILRAAVGVGRAVTPTPSGLYYITELLRQPDPNGLYGPYAFGLSAHSNVLHEFAGRNGILGLHGTNYPQGIGTNVSHGCLRVLNHVIVKLAHTLPIGTPVRINRA